MREEGQEFLVARGGDVLAAVQLALDYGLAALCAEAISAMDRLLAATISYCRSRVQFGKPIGSFQALQHRMADMHGGMGMTDELDVSHYFKRLLAFELRSGTTQEHLETYCQLGLP